MLAVERRRLIAESIRSRGVVSVAEMAETLRAEAGQPVDRLGAGVPGLVDNDGVLRFAPNLPGAMWTCMGQGGAVCPAASGTAPLSTYVDVPAGGKLVYTFTGTTSSDPASSTLDFTGSLQPPHGYVDTNPGDNVVTDSVVIGIPPMGPGVPPCARVTSQVS